MNLDARTCYRALRSRDPRFDGRFFTGVASTGVFCRPVCPARTPRFENCRFFPHAAGAAAAGFRPCLRCRPEAAPGTPAWNGTETTVARALRLIAEGAMDAASVDALATRVGVGDRHLRRLFLRHVGATPIAVAQTQRVLFAKRLLDETTLPIATVARAAGFASQRRFNAAMHGTFERAPSALRRLRTEAPTRAGAVTLALAYRPPFDWAALLAYLAYRAIPGVESVRDGVYRRTIRIPAASPAILEVRDDAPARLLRVTLLPIRSAVETGSLLHVVARLRRLFDLDADPAALGNVLRTDPVLAPLLAARPGLRIPGAWDGFEVTARAILGQQVSVRAATTIAGRIAARCGEPIAGDVEFDRLFPDAATLARADLTGVGLMQARARTVQSLARAVAEGTVRPEPGAHAEHAKAALCAVPGIGPWTAAYVALRVLREPDAFPASDLGLRRAFARLAAAGTQTKTREIRPVTPTVLERAAVAWQPWRGYAAVYLWTWEASHAAVDG
jgi:AraC family transcriptional regulator of adaptative response / DNA-3-methyladenine glycosylase II